MSILNVDSSLLSCQSNKNVWIIKAAEGSRGRGIKILSRFQDILSLQKDFPTRIAQKYIERPLLVPAAVNNATGRVKFDIRVWVTVTSYAPLQAYIHKTVYGRRCSSAYVLGPETLDDEFTHLTNHSVQKKMTTDLTPAMSMKMKPMKRLSDAGASVKRGSLVEELDLLLHHVAIVDIVAGLGGERGDWEHFTWPTIKHQIRNMLIASADHVTHRDKSFEFLGIPTV
jgi:hypothetical protein